MSASPNSMVASAEVSLESSHALLSRRRHRRDRAHRVRKTLKRHPERFLTRVFTELEIAYCHGRVHELAVRFAAKEAMMKALGTGVRGIGWREIEILPDRRGKPLVYLHGKAKSAPNCSDGPAGGQHDPQRHHGARLRRRDAWTRRSTSTSAKSILDRAPRRQEGCCEAGHGDQMRAIEAAAFASGVTQPDLMETAGRAVAQAVRERLGGARARRILVLVGGGNNGGDGLVAARYLHDEGADVRVYLLAPRSDSDANYAAVQHRDIEVVSLTAEDAARTIAAGPRAHATPSSTPSWASAAARPLEGVVAADHGRCWRTGGASSSPSTRRPASTPTRARSTSRGDDRRHAGARLLEAGTEPAARLCARG